MKKSLLIPIAVFASWVHAQEKMSPAEIERLNQKYDQQFNEAQAFEKSNLADHPMGENAVIVGIEDGMPVYYTIDSRPQVHSMNVDYLNDGVIPGVSVNGEGMTAYIWDGGQVRDTHNDMVGRVTNVESGTPNHYHATGVAGVIISAGTINANGRGMARSAHLKSLNYTSGSTFTEMNTQAALADNSDYMISNHSYGSIAGWHKSDNDNQWYWYGYPNISETETSLFGFYGSNDQAIDLHARNYPYHTIFKSAGNNRNEGPPQQPITHYAYSPNGTWVQHTGVTRPNDCMVQNGYDCLPFNGSNAKNSIVVGAINPIGGDNRYQDPSDVVPSSFTSFGPTDDGRIKPDVTAIGSNVAVPSHTSNSQYISYSGTSFSAPAAAGVAVLLQQIAKEKTNGTQYLRSDMMKALLTHTAYESGPHLGPDYMHGFGLINAFGAAKTYLNVDGNSKLEYNTLNQGQTITMNFVALGTEPLKATIVWIDPQGTPLPQIELNNRTPKLVNDLDLRVTQGGNTYYPWKLDPNNPAAAATQGDNIVDNVEQVFIENPVAGQTYTLTISHKGNLTGGSQNFAMIVTGIDAPMAVEDVNLNNMINIYPNPVANDLNLQVSESISNVEIKLLDTVGNIVLEEKFDHIQKTQKINASKLPAGVYIAYIKTNKGLITKKIIKK